ILAGSGRRHHLRLAGRRVDYHSDRAGGGNVQLPDAGRPAGAARPGDVLAGPPFPPGQQQKNQGRRPLVQQELYPSDERREGHGDSGQPIADQAAPGVSEAVASFTAAPVQPHVETDPRTVVIVQHQLTVWKDELIAWFKTLASAAVYATLI